MSDMIQINRCRVIEYELQEHALLTQEEYKELLESDEIELGADGEPMLDGVDLDNYIPADYWVEDRQEPSDDRVYNVWVGKGNGEEAQ